MSTAARIVSVEFIDADTGRTFARSDLPVGQLPDSFAVETTLHLGGDPWLVVRAEPPTAAEFVAAGRLALTVRRVLRVSPEEILYSLPTICGALPVVGPALRPAAGLELHEDDWRQVELVSRSRAVVVNAELDAVQNAHDGVSVLGLHLHAAAGPVPAASIEPILRAFDLVVVDWCRGAVVGADDLPDYLRAVATM